MKTEKTDSPNLPSQRRYRFWLPRLAILLGLPLLFYYGYCWGLWGRGSLFLQYLFQCSCPAASEEARYPEYVDVLVPACQYRGSLLSPSGRWLYVVKEESGSTSSFLLNLETNEKTSLTFKNSIFYFLTDELFYVDEQYGGDEYILDRTTSEKYPIQRFSSLRSSGYAKELAEALYEAKFVFLLDTKDKVVALSPDFPASPQYNFYFNDGYIPGDAYDRLEQFLKANNIPYEDIPFRHQNEVVSPNGEFVARTDGIYSVETGQQVVEMIPTSSTREQALVSGWIYDGSAVLYSYSGYPCVIETSIPGQDGSICLFKVPQPVLKLKVPEEYLTPMQTP